MKKKNHNLIPKENFIKENYVPRKLYFRRDIAAYRGFAVMLVVLNHFEIWGFNFGFIGVDLFFVISGFVITRQLLHEYIESARYFDSKRGNISLRNFYIRRFRRIFPLAFIVLLFSVVASYILQNQTKFKSVVTDATWAFFSLANVNYMKQGAEYFGEDISKSPLLHFWSLAVEEQFYFVWPILFVVAAAWHGYRVSQRRINYFERLSILLISLFLFSFIAFEYTCFADVNRAYFSSLTRLWELAAGGLIALFSGIALSRLSKKQIWKLRKIAFFILLVAIPLTSKDRLAFSIPVIVFNFSLIILTQSQDSLVSSKYGNVLGNRIFQKIGELSYGIYLWHWTLYSFFLSSGLTSSLIGKLLVVVIAIGLSWVTNIFIEKPFRSKSTIELRPPIKFQGVRVRPYRNPKVLTSLLLTWSIFILFLINFKVDVFFSGFSNRYYSSSKAIENFAALSIDRVTTDMFPSSNNSDKSNTSSNNLTDGLTIEQLRKEILLSSEENKISNDDIKFLSASRKDSSSKILGMKCDDTSSAQPFPACSFGSADSGGKNYVLLGDSKAGAIRPILLDYFNGSNIKVLDWSMPGCKLVKSVAPAAGKAEEVVAPGCSSRRQWIQSNISNFNPEFIIVSEYPQALGDLRNEMSYLKKLKEQTNSKLVYILNNASVVNLTDCLDANGNFPRTCIEYEPFWKTQLPIIAAQVKLEGIPVVDFNQLICTANGLCPPVVNGKYTTRDGSHITRTYAEYISSVAGNLLQQVIPR